MSAGFRILISTVPVSFTDGLLIVGIGIMAIAVLEEKHLMAPARSQRA